MTDIVNGYVFLIENDSRGRLKSIKFGNVLDTLNLYVLSKDELISLIENGSNIYTAYNDNGYKKGAKILVITSTSLNGTKKFLLSQPHLNDKCNLDNLPFF